MTVKELRKLLARATKGPWRAGNWTLGIGDYVLEPFFGDEERPGEPPAANDLALIVALRNSADAMLDVVEAAQAYAKIMDNNEGYLCEEELALRDALAKLEGAG